jgi:hypothetical protein
MNTNDRLQWLLQALDNNDAADYNPDDCEQVQEWLDRYVEDQLRGKPLNRPEYQLVARHLPLCMDCMADYNDIRENLSELIAAGLPERPVPATSFEQIQVLQQALQAPSLGAADVATRVSGWRDRLPTYIFGGMRSRPEPGQVEGSAPTRSKLGVPLAITATIAGLEVSFVLTVTGDAGAYSLVGRFTPTQRQWRGQPLRLYRIGPPELIDEQPLSKLDKVTFANLTAGDYLLAFVPAGSAAPEDAEVPLILLTIEP